MPIQPSNPTISAKHTCSASCRHCSSFTIHLCQSSQASQPSPRSTLEQTDIFYGSLLTMLKISCVNVLRQRVYGAIFLHNVSQEIDVGIRRFPRALTRQTLCGWSESKISSSILNSKMNTCHKSLLMILGSIGEFILGNTFTCVVFGTSSKSSHHQHKPVAVLHPILSFDFFLSTQTRS